MPGADPETRGGGGGVGVTGPPHTHTHTAQLYTVILSHYALILFVVILCTHIICGYLVSLVAF